MWGSAGVTTSILIQKERVFPSCTTGRLMRFCNPLGAPTVSVVHRYIMVHHSSWEQRVSVGPAGCDSITPYC